MYVVIIMNIFHKALIIFKYFYSFLHFFFVSSLCKCVSFFECSWLLSVAFIISLGLLSPVLYGLRSLGGRPESRTLGQQRTPDPMEH